MALPLFLNAQGGVGMTLTLAQVLLFYAPIAGLVTLAFWVGALSQRVRSLEEWKKAALVAQAEGGVIDRLARLEVHQETQAETMKKIEREFSGVQRQLGNLVAEARRGGGALLGE